MANFIISPYAISFESIRNNLQTYVNSKSEDVWKDFYASSTGETIIELAAALGTFYAFQFISGRRECFLNTAQNYTSLLGLAENLGYNASRGNNLKVSLTITPNQTVVNLPKWTVVGSYGEYDVVLLEDTTLNEGIQTTVDVVIGNSMIESQSITTAGLTQFTFSNSNVTNDYRLILNSNEVPTSSSLGDALNDKYVTISNVYGSVDVMYLNTGDYKYKAGDTLYLNFIERNNVSYTNFTTSSITFDYAETIEGATLIADREDKEDKEKIRITAPIAHETANMIRSRKDYSKYLLVNGVDIIDANDKDIYPGLIQLTYLKSDKEIMTPVEKAEWLEKIEYMRPGGVAEAFITDPRQVEKTLTITIYKSSDEVSNSSLDEQIKEIVDSYNNSLGILLDLDEIEHDIEELDGVKICRVSLGNVTWSPNTAYSLYSSITNSYGNFYLSDYSFKSGTTEPTWSTLSIGDTIIDNQLIWKRIDNNPEDTISTWAANTVYNQYDCIKKQYVSSGVVTATYVAQCIGFIGTTGTVEPIWSATTQTDGNVVWEKTLTTTTNVWATSTNYSVGDLIKTSIEGTDTYYKCITAGTSGTVEPSWLLNTVYDDALLWQLTTNSSTDTWTASTNKQVGDIIKVVSSSDYYYEVITLSGKSGSTAPDWSTPINNKVSDNTLTWTKVTSLNNNIQLGWDEYLNATYTFTVV